MGTPKPGHLVSAGAASLVLASLVGGLGLSRLEGVPFSEGIWMAFAVVSTTGFGEGPATTPGQLVVMAVFAWAAASYFVLLVAASAYGQLLVDERRRLRILSQRDVSKLARELHRN